MTYSLLSASVTDFIGHERIDFTFRPDVNFLIGRNGTGKTTFIRLLFAAINVDSDELHRIAFDTITLTFVDSERNARPQLRIKKLSLAQPAFIFEFRYSSRSKFRRFSQQPVPPPAPGSSFAEFQAKMRHYSSMTSEFRRTFLANINLSWLPILRARHFDVGPYDELEYEESHTNNPIDDKIRDIQSSLTRYFSRLESRAAAETKNFQRDYFLSLLNFSPDNVFLGPQPSSASYDSLERVMHDIFLELGFTEGDFSRALTKHFGRVRSSASLLNTNDKINLTDYFILADTRRLSHVVDRFKEYERRKDSIFEPKSKFVSLMNDLLLNKTFAFNSSNEVVVTNDTSLEAIDLTDLSSGEKQIFVLFAETLLQEGRKFIYLADEPELSLHVEWQESIVRNIRNLNVNCQIVFATHSPDVVSSYQDSVIDFGKI